MTAIAPVKTAPAVRQRTAKLLIDQHGDDAAIHAAMEADRLLAEGALTGSATWRRVIKAMEMFTGMNYFGGYHGGGGGAGPPGGFNACCTCV